MGLASKRRVVSGTVRITIKPVGRGRWSEQGEPLIVRWIGARARREAGSETVRIQEICKNNIIILQWSDTFGRP